MTVPFKNSTIFYKDWSAGTPVVLIPGYLETHEIWESFAAELSKDFRIITLDLPGHGQSPLVAGIQTMELLAEAVDTVLMHLNISKAFVIGHSMGGYIALAFLSKYKQKLLGMCMMHSHPFADNSEKKTTREREVELVKSGKHKMLLQLSVPPRFAEPNHQRLSVEIEHATRIALECTPEGIVAMIEGMMARPDRQQLLKDVTTPILFVLGKADIGISYELMQNVAQRSHKGEVLVLNKSAHMGFIEEKELCLEVVRSYIWQHS